MDDQLGKPISCAFPGQKNMKTEISSEVISVVESVCSSAGMPITVTTTGIYATATEPVSAADLTTSAASSTESSDAESTGMSSTTTTGGDSSADSTASSEDPSLTGGASRMNAGAAIGLAAGLFAAAL